MESDTLPSYLAQEDRPAPYSSTPYNSSDPAASGPTPIIFPIAHGAITITASGDQRHIQVCSAEGTPAPINGVIRLDVPSTIKTLKICLSGVIESSSSVFSPYSKNRQDEHLAVGFNRGFFLHAWMFYHESKVLWEPADAARGHRPRDIPFQVSLPGRYESSGTDGTMLLLPPSLQEDGYGVRYFLKFTIDPIGILKRKTRFYIPVVYLPLHQPPLPSPPRLVALATQTKIPGPALDPEGWGHEEKTVVLKGQTLDLVLWVSRPRVVARGGSVEWLLLTSNREVTRPQRSTMRPRRTSHPKPRSNAPTTDLPPEAALDPNVHHAVAFEGSLSIGMSVTPTFLIQELGVRYDLRFSIRPSGTLRGKLSNSLTLFEVPLRIINTSEAPFPLPVEYYKRDNLGGMTMVGAERPVNGRAPGTSAGVIVA